MKIIVVEVLDQHAPALLSAVEEIGNEVGGRLSGVHRYPKETALTAASIGLGQLRAALRAQGIKPDPDYN